MQVMGFLSAKSPSVSKQYHYFISEKITLFGLKQLRPLLRMTQSSDRKNLNWKMLASEVWWTFATDVKTLTAQLAELHHTTS